MAVITIDHGALNELLEEDVALERLEQDGSMLGVLFEPNDDGSIDVEVEPNRPDLLSVEGIARALRGFLGDAAGMVEYPVADGDWTVEVADAVAAVRPHIACCRVTGLDLTQSGLDSIIQLQEKLTETYGRNRAKIAIGLHDAAPLQPPITYTAEAPDDRSFVPLGYDSEMTLGEIVDEHEKGREYGHIVADSAVYPLLLDADDTVLSFPPVINGVATEVTTDTEAVFLDVTGTSRQEVETALHIIAAALHERGGRIEAVQVDGERMPDMTGRETTLDPDYARRVSGLEDLSAEGIAERLRSMRYDATVGDDGIAVTVPAYRADVMHAYDLVEDVVIAHGYGSIEPALPDVSTAGGQSPERVFVDAVRDALVGAGAQECMTYILSSPEKLFDRMDRDHGDVVSMANPLTEQYTVVRDTVLPSLLQVLGDNQHNRYPQRLFEVGTVSRPDDDTATGASDAKKLAYVTAHSEASFAEVRGVVQTLCRRLGVELAVEETDHPSFAAERCGRVVVDGDDAGVIGEVAGSVRDAWGLEVPVAGFELDVATLREHGQ